MVKKSEKKVLKQLQELEEIAFSDFIINDREVKMS
jgi:hypothetical protein